MSASRRLLAFVIAALALSPFADARAALVDFSPDGRHIAYEWSGVLSVTALNGGPTEAVPGSERVEYARWSPTGRQLAFFTKSGARTELKLYNPATKKTRGVGGNLRPPFAWREDGNRFACLHDLENGGSEIVWYNLAENGVSFRVALPYSVGFDAPMVWLPNTDDLAFVASDRNVYTVEAGEFKKVTTSSDVLGMSLYAGGKKLVWARRGPNLRYILLTVYAYDLTARNVVRLGFPNRVAALNPDPRTAPESVDRVDFAPNGAHMLFYTALPGAKGRSAALYTVSMDGRTARQLQRAPLPAGADAAARTWSLGGVPETGDSLAAAWSRDGHAIAVRAILSGNQKLFTTAADGTGGTVIRLELRR